MLAKIGKVQREGVDLVQDQPAGDAAPYSAGLVVGKVDARDPAEKLENAADFTVTCGRGLDRTRRLGSNQVRMAADPD